PCAIPGGQPVSAHRPPPAPAYGDGRVVDTSGPPALAAVPTPGERAVGRSRRPELENAGIVADGARGSQGEPELHRIPFPDATAGVCLHEGVVADSDCEHEAGIAPAHRGAG